MSTSSRRGRGLVGSVALMRESGNVKNEKLKDLVSGTATTLIANTKIPKLADPDLSQQSLTAARDSWWMFNIIAEMVTAADKLSAVSPAVAIFGSARMKAGHPYYGLTEDIARRLSDAGFSVVSGGGPGLMEAA